MLTLYSFLQNVFLFVKTVAVKVTKRTYRSAAVFVSAASVITVVALTSSGFGSGGKNMLVDRIEWVIIPDAATAAAWGLVGELAPRAEVRAAALALAATIAARAPLAVQMSKQAIDARDGSAVGMALEGLASAASGAGSSAGRATSGVGAARGVSAKGCGQGGHSGAGICARAGACGRGGSGQTAPGARQLARQCGQVYRPWPDYPDGGAPCLPRPLRRALHPLRGARYRPRHSGR